MRLAPVVAERTASERVVVRRLLLASALMLFLELALIRWLGANIVHLSYFSNFVLLGSFLGIGIGFLLSRRDWSVVNFSPLILAFLVAGTLALPVSIDRTGADVIYFTSLNTSGPPAWLALPIVFFLVAAILAGPAEIVGRCFPHLPPLIAYKTDLIGSLFGIASFTALSQFRAPSVVWGLVVAAAFLILLPGKRRPLTALTCIALVAALAQESLIDGVSWSPYYKIETRGFKDPNGSPFLNITVNGVPHQLLAPAQWKLTHDAAQYPKPYERTPRNPLRDVLIIGAGSGSDVAVALRMGARHVDAVDIDPRILQIGAEKNFDRAYQDPRVTRHVNDGRAFLTGTDKRYDLILFALPDSLSLVNGASQIRLESYLFTKEAIESAREHLSDVGAFSMYNYYREGWLLHRLAGTTVAAFGHTPCVDRSREVVAVVTIARDPSKQRCASAYIPPRDTVAPARDDAPFLYFKGDSFPSIYLWTLAGILALSIAAVRAVGGSFGTMRPYADLFFMGAAFLLLETKNVATFALLFGTTWMVNALVFAGILLVVLAAVETTRRFRTPPLPVVFAGIAMSLIAMYAIEPRWLLSLPFAPRLFAAVLLAFLPIYLANIAFSKRFADSGDSRAAFGVNLLGAMVGGCLEYSALLTGYRNLLLVVAGLYLAAFILRPVIAPASSG